MRISFDGKLSGETVIETFEFGARLVVGETLSTASTTAVVYSGTDSSPSSVISGSASISGTHVTQAVTGGTTGNVYLLTCAVTTSLGQTLEMQGYLTIIP